ncbi:TetR/AcrR family transcriptional regulator [Streptomyces sp. C1-2]|uniref:TetR/AcrR family transcriptional regulator n=1 Tax=Streptomyces sp. C1-2 TaxID=2720022 RepID=UPI00143231EE|nr:TetR/AcrR family transcriptional regulator [Streptomyces sp. C1-2]NJP73640.1 TetR/AcrR family transcriptional regulator [Streptomyces sp. C1-2]
MPDRQRADARRNYARILAVAEQEVAAHGADASLERIARLAGVGSATVRRHFPGRRALLQAVFSERIESLCAHAESLTEAPEPRAALLEWLGALTDYSASARGMAEALAQDGLDDPSHESACAVVLTRGLEPLLRRAAEAGAVARDVTAGDLLALVTGIALATEGRPEAAVEARRLLELTVRGVSPEGLAGKRTREAAATRV